LRGFFPEVEEEAKRQRQPRRPMPPPPELPRESKVVAPPHPSKTSASERARLQQEAILRRLRGGA
jgi:hypothetical protein